MIGSFIDNVIEIMKSGGFHYTGVKGNVGDETLIFKNKEGVVITTKVGFTSTDKKCKNYRVKLSELNYVKPKKIVIKCDFSKNDK